MKLLLGYGLDLADNKLHLVGEVNSAMYNRVVRCMPSLGKNPTIVLNTEGGDFYQALAMYDYLKCIDHLTIICTGPVMSAGTIILQAAEIRLATPSAQLMIHYGEDANSSSSEAKHNMDMLKLMKSIISERIKVKKRTVNSWFAKDTYFTTQKAISVGLVDGVHCE